jgi:hypothetical protein
LKVRVRIKYWAIVNGKELRVRVTSEGVPSVD